MAAITSEERDPKYRDARLRCARKIPVVPEHQIPPLHRFMRRRAVCNTLHDMFHLRNPQDKPLPIAPEQIGPSQHARIVMVAASKLLDGFILNQPIWLRKGR